MGCAVACVASRCGLSYAEGLALFAQPRHAWTRGYYCEEVVEAFARAGRSYAFAAYDFLRHRALLDQPGTIVFQASSETYPAGHYFLRVPAGWMNPWSNFPRIHPVESRIEPSLADPPAYLIYASEKA